MGPFVLFRGSSYSAHFVTSSLITGHVYLAWETGYTTEKLFKDYQLIRITTNSSSGFEGDNKGTSSGHTTSTNMHKDNRVHTAMQPELSELYSVCLVPENV